MKKLLSAILGVMLVGSLFVSTGTTAKASSAGTFATNEQTGELVAAYRLTGKGYVKLSVDELGKLKQEKNKYETEKEKAKKEFDEMRNLSSTPSQIVSPEATDCYYNCRAQYVQSGYIGSVNRWQEERRISTYVYNNTQDNLTRTISASTTDTYTVNISVTGTVPSAFSAVLGSSWSTSYTYSDSLTTTIRPGYKSWVDWIPIKNNSYGTMWYHWYDEFGYEINRTQEWADLYTARQIYFNGKWQSDGIAAVYTAPQP